MFLSYVNCTLTTVSISAQPSSTSWLWQTNKEHCVCWRSQRISELPRGVRWVQFNWVSRSTAWNEIDTCVCLSESLANGMHVSQTSDLPTSLFFSACRAFTWKDTLGWRRMCWKISSWSKTCGKKRRSRKLRPQRQRWDASEISNWRFADAD